VRLLGKVSYKFLGGCTVSLFWALSVLLIPVQNIALAQKENYSVASINLCADQLLLLLADKSQIASLSFLSHDEAGSYFFERAREYPVNKGYAEQVLQQLPDLVIVGEYSNPHTVSALENAGLRVETLKIGNDVKSVLDNIVSVADWVGQNARGLEIVRGLEKRLAALTPAKQPRPIAAVFGPNGYTSGANTLRGNMMELAGWRNAATLTNIDSYGRLTLEALIHVNPDALIESPYSPGTYSRAQVMSAHPALRDAGVNPDVIHIPSRMTICGGPWTVDVIEQLQTERLNLVDVKAQ